MDEVNVDRVVIDRFEDGVYKASVYVINNKVETKIDCRPSDAVSLALKLETPVYVEDDVLTCKCIDRTNINDLDNTTLGTLIGDHGTVFWNV